MRGPAHARAHAWTRRYPPLAGALAALLLAILVLPSALNVPQSNPTQTLEFAPVPPEDQPPPPDSANASSLGLGASSTVTGDGQGGTGAPPDLPPPPVPEGVGELPTTKRCVGDPSRQTEDLLSPPCVAHFEGDNFGATHRGVTGEEIRLVFYLDTNFYDYSNKGLEARPADECFDVAAPPTDEDHMWVRVTRNFQRYFNDRYQTYGRFAHFWVCFGDTDEEGNADGSPEARRADAAEHLAHVDPFAAFLYTNPSAGNEEVYGRRVQRVRGIDAAALRSAPGRRGRASR